METFLFVHGAFQGGWVWKYVSTELAQQGHQTHAPTLSGCGYLSNGFKKGIGLTNYIQDVTNYLFFHDLQDVVMVAHSYSGMVAAAAAMRSSSMVKRLVFVDSIIPEQGRSFADMSGEAFRHMLDSNRVDGWKIKPWPLQVFGVPKEKAEWFGPRLREFPEAAFTTPFPDDFDTGVVPASFIGCSNTANKVIREMETKARSLGWPVASLASAHSPMTTHPIELAGLLVAAAKGGNT